MINKKIRFLLTHAIGSINREIHKRKKAVTI